MKRISPLALISFSTTVLVLTSGACGGSGSSSPDGGAICVPCGNTCIPLELASSTSCFSDQPPSCPVGTVLCGLYCVSPTRADPSCRDAGTGIDAGPDTNNDANNCGQIGHTCAATELCVSGACVADKLDKLSFDVVDARYSTALDRMIILGSFPIALHLYDAAARKDTAITLPVVPTSVSITPDGHKAVVGHDGYVSYVDLDAAKVLGTFHVSMPVGNVVAGGNGKAYAFPSSGTQRGAIHTVDLASGSDDGGGYSGIYGGTVGALHPNGNAIYAADRGFSPSNLQKFDITSGKPMGAGQTLGSDYEVCGDLWISKSGLRIFTACGNIFTASQDKSTDMSYSGSLGKVSVTSLDDTSNRVAALISNAPSGYGAPPPADELRFYEAQYLAQTDKQTMPPYRAGSKTVPTKGKFVFFRADGNAVYVIVQADTASNAQYPFAVATLGNGVTVH